MAVSRKAMTEGLSEWASSDPLSPSVRTGAAPLDQQGEPLPSSGTAAPCHLYITEQLPLAIVRFRIAARSTTPEGKALELLHRQLSQNGI